MKLELVRIGNSRGIRIPKPLIEQCGFGDTVDLQVERGRLIVTPGHTPRAGWREAFSAAGPGGGDPILLDFVTGNEFDATEWTW